MSQCCQDPPLGVSLRPAPPNTSPPSTLSCPGSTAFSCPTPILSSLWPHPLRTDVSSVGAVIYYHCKHPGLAGCAKTGLEPLCWGLSANITQLGSDFYGAKGAPNEQPNLPDSYRDVMALLSMVHPLSLLYGQTDPSRAQWCSPVIY